ncbi:hypothetical protein Bca4012_075533 [Brassica carinata]|uniref:Uncharacterized protein n=1 Tax=Brassica carinata TaxID=52824 RepID=A0A8X7U5I2_BRACI|nr:hypothetical protein Bca52824_074064 [Brassica carinata]
MIVNMLHKKLASAIVTPSRLGTTDNVTVRSRVDDIADGRILTFSPQAKDPIDDQIIGALSDMELVDQQGSGLMDTDVNEDDLLGAELIDMEGEDPSNADRDNADLTKVMGSIDERRGEAQEARRQERCHVG